MIKTNLPVPKGSLEAYLVEINKYPVLSREEERRLALHYRATGDPAAAHKLVTSNLRFVVKIAYEYSSYGIKMADLIQEGNIGLMKAVQKYDPDKGYKLISYAVWWIRAYVQNHILNSWSLVKIGTTQAQRKLFYKLRQAKRALIGAKESESLNDEEADKLAEQLNVKGNEVMEMEVRLGRDSSLNAQVGEDGTSTFLDMLPGVENQEEAVAGGEIQKILKREVAKALTHLDDREKYIVEKRLMSDDPITLQAIGDKYKVSRERARQLEERAKKKLKAILSDTVPADHSIPLPSPKTP
jgi:RNA polymerase sigma-32 factor